MRRLLKSTFASPIALILNLAMAYAIFLVARLAYFFVNYSYFADGLTASSLSAWVRGSLLFDTSAILYTHIPYIVMMLLPLWLKENRGYHRVCKWLFVVVNAASLAINLADSVYFPFTLRRTTTSVFREFDNENNISGILLHNAVTHWYLLLLFFVMVWLAWKLYAMPRNDYRSYVSVRSRWMYSARLFACLAVAGVLTVAGCRGGLQSGVRPITISNANQYVDRPTDCALVLNTPFALIRTIGKSDFTVPDYFPSLAASAQVYTPFHQQEYADSAAAGKPRPNRKNIVILIVESFGREYIGGFNKDFFGGKYKGYTPYVDKLIEKSLVYRYSFCNGRKSIDGMPSVLCGIPRFGEPFILTPASMNDYTGIPGLLSRWGYQTAFFHGANRGSMGFLAFANKIGFQSYYGRQDYAADPRFGGDKDFDGNWGIWDEPFLQYYCTKMGEMKQPFMTALFTVSSHDPFVVPEKYRNVYKEENLPIHKCIRYTDMAIGKFFASASKQKWFKNTIFVLTSDHTNQSDHEQYKTDIGGFCSPIIIYDPSGEIQPGRVDGIAQQTDIMPTLLNHVGYPEKYLSFGFDLLRTPARETWAVNYLNGIYQYVKYGYVLQWDGKKTRAVYRLTDLLMQRNLVGRVPEQAKMERELKGIIYQYMYRMVHDQLRAGSPAAAAGPRAGK
ncbi:LTA synthase family protein [Prevotella dentasini]